MKTINAWAVVANGMTLVLPGYTRTEAEDRARALDRNTVGGVTLVRVRCRRVSIGRWEIV